MWPAAASFAFVIAFTLSAARRLADPDRVGVVASTLCAVHCLATTLVLGLAGVRTIFADERVEMAFSVCAIALALAALVRGSLRHRRRMPPAIGVSGMVLLLIARCADLETANLEVALSVLGGGVLVTAHLLNIQALRRVGACCEACEQ